MKEIYLWGAVAVVFLIGVFFAARSWARGGKASPRPVPKEWL